MPAAESHRFSLLAAGRRVPTKGNADGSGAAVILTIQTGPLPLRWPLLAVALGLDEEEDQIGSPLDAVLGEQVRDVELGRSLGHVQLAADLLVGEVLHEELDDLLLPAAHPHTRRSRTGPPRALEGGIYESRE